MQTQRTDEIREERPELQPYGPPFGEAVCSANTERGGDGFPKGNPHRGQYGIWSVSDCRSYGSTWQFVAGVTMGQAAMHKFPSKKRFVLRAGGSNLIASTAVRKLSFGTLVFAALPTVVFSLLPMASGIQSST